MSNVPALFDLTSSKMLKLRLITDMRRIHVLLELPSSKRLENFGFMNFWKVHKNARNFSTTNGLLLNRTVVALIL
jgi:hypothetical protein